MKSSALALTTATPKTRAPLTDAQILRTQSWQTIAKAWNALSDQSRFSWFLAAQALNARQTALTQPALNAYSCYLQCATAATSAGLPMPQDAPDGLQNVLPLPAGLRLSASGPAPFSLTLTCQDYPNAVIFYASAPVYQTQDTLHTEFKIIGFAPSLPADDILDLSNIWRAKYRACGPGMKVALQAVGVDANGFCTAPLSLMTNVQAASALTLSADGK